MKRTSIFHTHTLSYDIPDSHNDPLKVSVWSMKALDSDLQWVQTSILVSNEKFNLSQNNSLYEILLHLS